MIILLSAGGEIYIIIIPLIPTTYSSVRVSIGRPFVGFVGRVSGARALKERKRNNGQPALAPVWTRLKWLSRGGESRARGGCVYAYERTNERDPLDPTAYNVS